MDRNDYVRRRRFWYEETSREAVLEELFALASEPKEEGDRLTSIAIVGEANAGKTRLAREYLERHPSTDGETGRKVPAIYVSLTLNPRVEDLSVALLMALGDLDPTGGNHRQRVQRFIDLAQEAELGLTFIDEFHDASKPDSRGRGRGEPFVRLVKGLMNAGQRVVPMGTEVLKEVLGTDTQLNTRFNYRRGRLKRLEEPGDIKRLMMDLAGLSEDEEDVIEDDAILFVLKQCRGVLGHSLDLIQAALVHHGDLGLAALETQREFLGDTLDGLV